jgi:hypothetical protein
MITTLFGEEEISIIADSEDFLTECSRSGFKTDHIFNLDTLPKNSVIFSFSNEAAKLTFELAKNTKSRKVIFCATQVFEPSLEAALYSLQLLLKSNFETALRKQRCVLDMLNSHDSFFLSGNDADARIIVQTHAQPYALIKEDIEGDFVQSVADFFEVHYAHMNPQEPCPFSFNGTLKISGILTALRNTNPSLPENIKTPLKHLSYRISQEGALLSIKDNTIVSIRTKNEEHINLLSLAAGPRGLKLTEFAIGVNEVIASCIDYKINSQMNEGISGVHLAIGDGSSGYHIDFLSPAVNVCPM